jgi:hypothetical protein
MTLAWWLARHGLRVTLARGRTTLQRRAGGRPRAAAEIAERMAFRARAIGWRRICCRLG